jgi:hypothetical protein
MEDFFIKIHSEKLILFRQFRNSYFLELEKRGSTTKKILPKKGISLFFWRSSGHPKYCHHQSKIN